MTAYSERAGLAAAFVLSLAFNSVVLLATSRSLGPEARWHRPQALDLVARQRARRLELEFVEAPPQKPLRKPERTKKIAAQDSLAQDLKKLKTEANLAPAVSKLGPADQLAQQRMKDRLVPPLRAPKEPKPQATAPKEPVQAEPALPGHAADPQSWLPVPAEGGSAAPFGGKAATTVEKVPATEKAPPDEAQEQAMDRAAAMLTSKDKITTMEMAVKRSSGAPFQGVTSFEATGSGMGAYMKNLKDKIWLSWFPYIAFRYPVDFRTSDAIVKIAIGKQGEVKQVEVVNYNGSPMFATFCLQAVRRASGFGPLPQDLIAMMGKDELEIKFAFHYR